MSSDCRPSRNGQDGLRAGTVKARRPRACAGGATRRALHGAEHRSSLDLVMAGNKYNTICYNYCMSGLDLRNARRQREWTQAELAHRLGVTQAYVCLLERNRRAVPPRLAKKLASVLKLSPSTVPVGATRKALTADEATAALGAVGYPGFAYLRKRPVLNPAELLLRALRHRDVDA